MKIRNTFIIFLVSGFWHGANWTFIVWGALNALYFLPLLLSGKNRNHLEVVAYDKSFPSFKEILQIGITFGLTVFAWIFFRAENLGHAFGYINGIFSDSIIGIPEIRPSYLIALLVVALVLEWIGRRNQFAIESLRIYSKFRFHYLFYLFLCYLIFIFGGQEQEFIYFQF